MIRLMLLIVIWGSSEEPVLASAPQLSTMKLIKCTYTLQKNEVMSQTVNKLVSSSKNFPLRTWGKSGRLDVTENLNGDNFDGNAQKPGSNFDILIPEIRLKSYKNQLKNCSDSYYLVRTSQNPSEKNVGQLTANSPLTKNLKESDLAADYDSLQKIMPTLKHKGAWFFLMRFQIMIKEVSPIVETLVAQPIPDAPLGPEVPEPLAEEPAELTEPDIPPILSEDLTDEKIAELTDEEADCIDLEVFD